MSKGGVIMKLDIGTRSTIIRSVVRMMTTPSPGNHKLIENLGSMLRNIDIAYRRHKGGFLKPNVAKYTPYMMDFSRLDLQDAIFDNYMEYVNLDYSNMIGSTWEGCRTYEKLGCRCANLDNSKFLSGLFKHCDFSSAHMRNCTFNWVNFERCSFDNVDFANSTFNHCHFEHCDLGNAKFRDANFIEGCSFDDCHMGGVTGLPSTTDMLDAYFTKCDGGWIAYVMVGRSDDGKTVIKDDAFFIDRRTVHTKGIECCCSQTENKYAEQRRKCFISRETVDHNVSAPYGYPGVVKCGEVVLLDQ